MVLGWFIGREPREHEMAMLSADAMWGVPNCCSFLRVQSLTTLVTHAILCPVGIHWQKNASLGSPVQMNVICALTFYPGVRRWWPLVIKYIFFKNVYLFKMVYFISTREIQFHSIPFYLFKNVDSKLFVYNLTFTARIQIIFSYHHFRFLSVISLTKIIEIKR